MGRSEVKLWGSLEYLKQGWKTLNEDGGRDERLNARWGKHVRYISSLEEVRHIHYHWRAIVSPWVYGRVSPLRETVDKSNLWAMRPDRAVRGETELILIRSHRGTRLWTRVPIAWRAVQSLVDGFALYSPLGFVVSFCLYTLPDLAGGYLVIYLWSWSRT